MGRDRSGRYCAWSEHAHPGFVAGRHHMFDYWVSDNEWLECVDYRNHGTYRGIAVHVSPNGIGTLVITPARESNGSRAPDDVLEEAGFEWDGRPGEPWIKIVEPDDPDMEVVTTRAPIDPPWIKNGEAPS
ncbi:hypothetical protein QQX02_05010 [Demequina sp. EGI L300058]|uniref:Uncharacterized protein n=1 Tax=Demequina muriae TaxID=3051664 RepID=A0ABT8GFR2_9MICO|nr:hypothetical protein [Demequina sp. EGI L300058]